MSSGSGPDSFRLRRVGGGEDNSQKIFNAPGVVIFIAALSILVFLFFIFAPERMARLAEVAAAIVPARIARGPEANGGYLAMLFPFIAHQFVHAGLAHLGFNLLWLLAFGTPLARRMGAEGALQSSGAFAAASTFLTFYLLSGAVGAAVFVAAHANQMTLMVGASGAVSGLLGGLVRFAFSKTSLFGPEAMRFSPLLSRPVAVWTIFMAAMNNPLSAQLLGAFAGGVQIAWETHLGGYFFGLLTYPFFERMARRFR